MNIEKEVEICEGKLNAEANKKIINSFENGSLWNSIICEKCEGYNIKCSHYHQSTSWRGKD